MTTTMSAVMAKEVHEENEESSRSFEELGIEERKTVQGVLYVLPARPNSRAAGIFLILFGLLFGGFPVGMLVEGVRGVMNSGDLMGLLFGLFTLPFVLSGLGLVILGQAMFRGRTELEIANGELRVREQLGLFHWSSRRPIGALTRVVVGARAKASSTHQSAPTATSKVLRLEFEGARALWLALGYSRELLTALGARLSREAEFKAAELVVLPPAPEPRDRRIERSSDEELELSPDTDLEIERRGSAVLVHIPPRGVWKGSRGLFGMGIFFVLFITVFAGATVVYPLIRDGFSTFQLPFFLVSLFFGSIGFALLLGGWNMGRRKATLAATGEKLVIERISMFGTKRLEWRGDEVDDVRIGPSGMAVNNVPVLELQVRVGGEKALGMLSQRSDEEIRWIARELREALTAS